MNLDFQTPNKRTLGWIDSYFQFHDDNSVRREAELIAGRNYDNNYDGWEEQPQPNIISAFYEFRSAMARFEITEDDINNQ